MADGAPGGDLDGRLSAQELKKEWKASADAPHQRGPSAVREWVRLLLKAGVCALLLYRFVFQVFVVRQDSMRPTYLEGDWVVVDKLTYVLADPGPGEVVVFELWVQDKESGRRLYRDYIKRIAATPGDRVRLVGGMLYVNGRLVQEPWAEEEQEGEASGPTDEYYVPPGHYFVLGDNRANSRDSRYDPARGSLGLIPRERLKGKVRWRCWPWRSSPAA
jgi:signal peptidase I